MSKTSIKDIEELLSRGVAESIDREHLRARLERGDPLRVKLGIDPTGERLHLGHAVPLRILRRFQDLGHIAVLIVGDVTARIGDPTGRNETRPSLTKKDIARNLATYEKQALKILDRKRFEFHWQSEWFDRFKLEDVIREASKLSAGWVLSHETFRNRVRAGQPLAFHELLYPLLQAYDSLAVKADVELGGLDQRFNVLTGREFMKAHGVERQDVVLAKYLIGTDGQKMGKTLGNFIALDEEPFNMFGKIMSMPDAVLRDYYELTTDIPMEEIGAMQFADVAARDSKMRLAETIVGMYHGKKAAREQTQDWKKKYVTTKTVSFTADAIVAETIPSDTILNLTYRDILVKIGEATSKGDAQRKIQQGGLVVDGNTEKDWKKTPINKQSDQQKNGKGQIVITVGKQKHTYIIKRLVH